MRRNEILEICASVLLIVVVVALLYVWMASPLGTSDKVGITMAISTVALVIVTSIYAWHTRKMAEEMREQRYSENLPLLVPDIPPILRAEKLPIEAMQSGNTVKVVWGNVGKGVAINSRFSFWCVPLPSGRVNFFPPSESVTLEVGGIKEVDYSEILNDSQLLDIPLGYCPHLLAEYQDIYERKITTVQEFHIDEEDGNKRVSLGELYFTVNGRRLGEEVSQP